MLINRWLLIVFLVVSMSAQALEVKIDRVIKPSVHTLQASEKGFSFMRELCTDRDIFVKVYKKFVNRDTKEVYPSPYPSEYEFKEGCHVAIYTVPLDVDIPKGVYDYQPVTYIKTIGGDSIERDYQSLPIEVFLIK